MTLVDLATDRVAGQVSFPEVPDAFAVSSGLGRIYGANRAARKLYVFNLATRAVEHEIDLPIEPRTTLLSPDGYTLAIADGESRLALVDLAEARVRGLVEGLEQPGDLAFSNDSFHLFVPNDAAGRIEVIDTMSAIRLDPITLSFGEANGLSAVTRTPNGLYGLVVEQATGRLSVINFRNWEEMRMIEVGAQATRPYGTADGQFMMIANDDAATLTVISTAYFDTEAVIPAPKGVTSITTGFFETLAFITSESEMKSLVVDLETMEPVGEILYGGTPGPALVDPDGKRMYVPVAETGELVVVDVYNKEIISRVKGMDGVPTRIALAATNNYCH